MLSDRIQNAPLLTFDDALDLFEAATNSLPEHFSVNQLCKAYLSEISVALAVSAGELTRETNGPPWMKADPHKLSNTAA